MPLAGREIEEISPIEGKRTFLSVYLVVPLAIVLSTALGSFIVLGKALILEAFLAALLYQAVAMGIGRYFESVGDGVEVAVMGIKGVLPTILILGPIIIYVFTITSTVPAVIFMIWSLLVGMSDSFLKPLLLGRGLDVPMLVILLGAIGGMILSGIIGLFVGAVVLAVGYELFVLWLNQDTEAVQDAPVEN